MLSLAEEYGEYMETTASFYLAFMSKTCIANIHFLKKLVYGRHNFTAVEIDSVQILPGLCQNKANLINNREFAHPVDILRTSEHYTPTTSHI